MYEINIGIIDSLIPIPIKRSESEVGSILSNAEAQSAAAEITADFCLVLSSNLRILSIDVFI